MDLSPSPLCTATDFYVNSMADTLLVNHKNPRNTCELIIDLMMLGWPRGFIAEVFPALKKRLNIQEKDNV